MCFQFFLILNPKIPILVEDQVSRRILNYRFRIMRDPSLRLRYACMLAKSPKVSLCTRVLQPLRYLHDRSDCYRLE